MIVNEILGNLESFQTQKKIEVVQLEWFEMQKRILRKETDTGREVGIQIQNQLNDGDILFEGENFIIIVKISPSDLIKITVDSMEDMGRLGFELGNRHLSLKITNNIVLVPFDHPTYEYLIKLGFKAEKVKENFSDYIQCKSHEHTNNHHHHKHGHSHE